MNRTISASLAALLLSGSLTALAAEPQGPPPDSTQPAATQSPAPIERPAPGEPPAAPAPPRGLRPPHPPMMHDHGRGMDRDRFHRGEQTMGILPPGMWWHNPERVQQLGLTPEQTKRMDDILQKSRLQLIDLKANLDRQNLLLEPLLNANPVDQARAMAQIDKVAQARAELEKANAKMLLGIRGVLTPEQWTRLHDRRELAPGTPTPPMGRRGGGSPGERGPSFAPEIDPR